jgi:alkylation response protein AidB-like acyl-CoA dehydrogenase
MIDFFGGVIEKASLQTGLTVILVERSEGVETKAIKTSYSSSAGTAYVTFDNVKVPVENTLGPEGGGIFVILSCVPFLRK